MLKAGFARIDITPPFGINIEGYYEPRIADGILDPLLATAIVFDDGERRAALLSVDIVGMSQPCSELICKEIAEAIETSPDSIIIACTHTHVGPAVPGMTFSEYENTNLNLVFENDYAKRLKKCLIDVSILALSDLAPVTKMLATHGEAKDIAFIRRYRMKDGTIRTNPGWQNPDIAERIGNPDEESSLLIIKRENAKEIGIVHFQVHADLVGRTKFTADFPKFVRDTYEANIENSLCMYLTGTQGDTNHIDVRRNPETDVCCKGYERAKYMGRKIAFSVLSNYPLATEIKGDRVRFARKYCEVEYNKGTPEELPEALRIAKIYYEKGSDAAVPGGNAGMRRTQTIARATRIALLADKPDKTKLSVSAIAVGDAVIGGFSGEPFTEFGRTFKDKAPFSFAIPLALANGIEGYFPPKSAFSEGAYEANSSRFKAGTGEILLEELLKITNALK